MKTNNTNEIREGGAYIQGAYNRIFFCLQVDGRSASNWEGLQAVGGGLDL